MIIEAREDIADDPAAIVKYCIERAGNEITPVVPFAVNRRLEIRGV